MTRSAPQLGELPSQDPRCPARQVASCAWNEEEHVQVVREMTCKTHDLLHTKLVVMLDD